MLNTDAADVSQLVISYENVRDFTLQIASPLSSEDCAIQSMPDVSPTRWHLAHTTWFFETFLLRNRSGYQPFDSSFEYLFNSYYNQVGDQYPRWRRGLISRPGLEETFLYRKHVDQAMLDLIQYGDLTTEEIRTLRTGLHHEQQHQELMFTDIKHVLSCNPTSPVYRDCQFDSDDGERRDDTNDSDWIHLHTEIVSIGHQSSGFAFDNEFPVHKTLLHNCRIASNLVTCGQYIEFIESGGYDRPEFWLSAGWDTVQQQKWRSPLYWTKRDDRWYQFTLAGLVPVDPNWPVCHVSMFEADAFARWSDARLPTEFEWESGQRTMEPVENLSEEPFADRLFRDGLTVHPTRQPNSFLGGVWQWTSSSYAPYPGYQPPTGAIGEYNGKFMCNQYVLRGGSVATSSTHIRPTYRNFFPAEARWQFSGIRLAQSL